MGGRWQGIMGIGETVASAVLTDDEYFGVNDANVTPEAEFNKADVAAGSRDFNRSVMVSQSAEGNIDAEMDGELLGWMLKYLVGAPAAPVETPPASGQWVHTFLPKDFLTEFYMRKIKGKEGSTTAASDKIWGLNKMATGTLSAAAGEKLMGAFTFLCREWIDSDAGHPAASFAFLDLAPFIYKGLTPLIDTQGSWPPSTAFGTMESFELSWDNGLVGDKRTANGSFLPASFPEGKREIGLTITKEFEDETLWGDFIAETEKMLKLSFTGPTGYALDIEFPRLKIIGHDRGGPIGGGNDRLVGTVEMVPLYDATETVAVRFILTNTRAAQY